MRNAAIERCHAGGWLDRLAISFAAVCAVHCLLTPVLIIVLPIVATSFFVHEDFHLWMMVLVLPTTCFAIFMGCRKHKDRYVAALSAIGLSILLLTLIHERSTSSAHTEAASCLTDCKSCARDIWVEPIPMQASVWFNTLGGLLLASAHVRNFSMCRKLGCRHSA
jgi:hypothetical protein